MEIVLAIIAVVFFIYFKSCNDKTLDAINDLKGQIESLRRKLQVDGKLEKQSASFPKKSDTVTAQPFIESEKQQADVLELPPSHQPQAAVVEEVIFSRPIVPSELQQTKPSKTDIEDVQRNSGERKQPKDVEKLIGINLLSKIGIVTLVLGIGYFVKYAIDREWIGENMRVALGILCGGIIIGAAHKLKKKYRTFSSILVGGGISVLYITISIAFHDYRIFSQTLAFVLLIVITALSVFLALLYERKELAVFSLLGGFASPMMVSTDTGNYTVLFSYIFILNAGMLVVSFKKQWRVIGTIAFGLTQLFFWSWLVTSFTSERTGATIFILLFFLQFYLLALIDHYRSKKEIKAFHLTIILGNNLSLYAAALVIFSNSDMHVNGLITISMAILNAIPLLILHRDKTIDKRLIHTLIAIVLIFVGLAAPVQLDGCAITMFWAAESVLLLWLWQQSGIRIFSISVLLTEFLAFTSLTMDWQAFYVAGDGGLLPLVFNRPFITGIVFTVSVWMNAWLRRKSSLSFPAGLGGMKRAFSVVAVLMLFFTLFWELQYQMNRFFPAQLYFRWLIYGLYFFLFTGTLTGIAWKRTRWTKTLFVCTVAFTLIFPAAYLPVVYHVRLAVMFDAHLNWGHVAVHFPALLSLVLFFAFLIRNRHCTASNFVYWFVTVVAVAVLSIEADHLMLMICWPAYPYLQLLEISHTIIYPVLWGTSSFVLMIIGMKRKLRVLRIISLSLFVLIIAKLYLHDIWQMEQAGRIAALVFLGMLFLLVSFLYQKLKILLQKEN
ncbi:MAG: DUF2339 domain-containing protein [Bacteroidales bacterium]|jgi:uncharacterized membrane protein|nr:DUF2339 domain-containing protein [Bacteroidales bacterium]